MGIRGCRKLATLSTSLAPATTRGGAQLCLAIATNLVAWATQCVILPAYKGNWNVGWTKSGALVQNKSMENIWIYWFRLSPTRSIPWDPYATDHIHWTEATTTPVLPRRAGKFDSVSSSPALRPSSPGRALWSSTTGADDNPVCLTGRRRIRPLRRARVDFARRPSPILAPKKKGEGWPSAEPKSRIP
jgi:hypothetical protein